MTDQDPWADPDLEGPLGKAWDSLRTVEPTTPDHTASIAAWFLHVPSAHPAWTSYHLAVVSLRDIEGVEPAHKDYPEAEYELMVLALDPREQPNPRNGPWPHLTPGNVRHQWHGTTDEQAAEIAKLTAKACLDGLLHPEPQGILGARLAWGLTIDATAAHYMAGLH